MTPPRVLVVDDEPSVLLLCEYVLREAAITVDTAGSATEAIALMARETYDAMLIDLVMPSGGGARAIQAAGELCPHTPVIVMTAEPRHLVPPRIGMRYYLHKPFHGLKALEEVVNLALGRGQGGPDAPVRPLAE